MRVTYNANTPQGAILAEAVDHLIKGRASLKRWADAADVATNTGGPRDFTKLEGGAFGADSGKGEDLWNQAISVRDLLNADDAGGLTNFLAVIDQGG